MNFKDFFKNYDGNFTLEKQLIIEFLLQILLGSLIEIFLDRHRVYRFGHANSALQLNKTDAAAVGPGALLSKLQSKN